MWWLDSCTVAEWMYGRLANVLIKERYSTQHMNTFQVTNETCCNKKHGPSDLYISTIVGQRKELVLNVNTLLLMFRLYIRVQG